MRQCKHCNEFFDISDKPSGWMANHVRWCHHNPKRQQYVDTLKSTQQASLTEEIKEKRSLGVKQAWKSGAYSHVDFGKGSRGRKHTPESIENLRQKALASKHRRLKKNTVMYKGVLLDSSWELALAERLDEMQVRWVRPEPIPWIDGKGYKHNYFPDFYLPDFDLYLDPKNPAAWNNQYEKIQVLQTTYPNIKFLLSKEECSSFTLE